MLKPYPPEVFEVLARLNRLALGWLAGAVKRGPLWLASQGEDKADSTDSSVLSSVISSVNLWVGEGTMLVDSPSLARACTELKDWAAEKPGRAELPETCRELLQAVLQSEVNLTATQ